MIIYVYFFFLTLCLSAGFCHFAGLQHDAKLQHNALVTKLALFVCWLLPFCRTTAWCKMTAQHSCGKFGCLFAYTHMVTSILRIAHLVAEPGLAILWCTSRTQTTKAKRQTTKTARSQPQTPTEKATKTPKQKSQKTDQPSCFEANRRHQQEKKHKIK